MLPFASWSKKRKRRWGRERKIRGEERGGRKGGEKPLTFLISSSIILPYCRKLHINSQT